MHRNYHQEETATTKFDLAVRKAINRKVTTAAVPDDTRSGCSGRRSPDTICGERVRCIAAVKSGSARQQPLCLLILLSRKTLATTGGTLRAVIQTAARVVNPQPLKHISDNMANLHVCSCCCRFTLSVKSGMRQIVYRDMQDASVNLSVPWVDTLPGNVSKT